MSRKLDSPIPIDATRVQTARENLDSVVITVLNLSAPLSSSDVTITGQWVGLNDKGDPITARFFELVGPLAVTALGELNLEGVYKAVIASIESDRDNREEPRP